VMATCGDCGYFVNGCKCGHPCSTRNVRMTTPAYKKWFRDRLEGEREDDERKRGCSGL